jgi:hypothetical protein
VLPGSGSDKCAGARLAGLTNNEPGNVVPRSGNSNPLSNRQHGAKQIPGMLGLIEFWISVKVLLTYARSRGLTISRFLLDSNQFCHNEVALNLILTFNGAHRHISYERIMCLINSHNFAFALEISASCVILFSKQKSDKPVWVSRRDDHLWSESD